MRILRRHFLSLCGATGMGAIAGCSEMGGDDLPSSVIETGADDLPIYAPEDLDSFDLFGESVNLSSDGTTAIVGAHNDEDPNGQSSGSAYILEERDGSWTRAAKLTPFDGREHDSFGNAVALSGDGTTAIVGAELDNHRWYGGSVYVFEVTDGSWSQRTELTADDSDHNDHFGKAVALSRDGTTALIGAHLDEDPHGDEAGSAYIFESTSGEWAQEAKLVPEDGSSRDNFGETVALSDDGTTSLVGSPYYDGPNSYNVGAAYVFGASDQTWSQQAKIVPSEGDNDDLFGTSVSLSGDGTTALVGADADEHPDAQTVGSAYVLEAADGSWRQQVKLTPEDGRTDDFGRAVSMSSDGTVALVGARDTEGVGLAYVFQATDDTWNLHTRLDPEAGGLIHNFTSSVALSYDGSTCLIGVPNSDVPDGPEETNSGSVYTFTL